MDISYYKKYEPLFNSWYIKKLIGEGSFGKVFEIERSEMGQTYKAAVKVITVPQNQSEVKSLMADGMDPEDVTEYYKGLVQAIIHELVLLSKLKGNSHIVSYEDHMLVEHEDGIGWDLLIRMELLTPLYDHLKKQDMTADEVVRIGIDLCMALELCQKYNIVHRDVKPENIFISPSGDYKLGDFGIAKTIEKTSSGLSRKGTYTYMAPEVYRGAAYGSTVDIYSLGIVMYRLLNDNRTPFLPPYPEKITYSSKEDALVKRIKGEPIPRPLHGSDRLAEIVLKACAFEAEDRYQSALELQADLEDVLIRSSNAEQILLQDQAPLHSVHYTASSGDDESGSEQYAETESEETGGRYPDETAETTAEKTELLYDEQNRENTDDGKTDEDKIVSMADLTEGTEYPGSPVPNAENMQAGAAALPKTAGKSGKKKQLAVSAVILAAVILAALFFLMPREVTDITGIETDTAIYVGDTLKPEYTAQPEHFRKQKITFLIADTKIAEVDEKGAITAKIGGQTTLTLQAGDYRETVNILVRPKVSAIKNVDKTIELSEGESKTLKPKLLPKKFAKEKITYEIKNKKIASVTKNGKIKAKAPGKTKLIISAGGFKKTVRLIVYAYAEYSGGGGSSDGSGGSGGSSGGAVYNTPKRSSGGYYNPPSHSSDSDGWEPTEPPTAAPPEDDGQMDNSTPEPDDSDNYIDWE